MAAEADDSHSDFRSVTPSEDREEYKRTVMVKKKLQSKKCCNFFVSQSLKLCFGYVLALLCPVHFRY